jgi:hypothetical protein
MLCAMLQKRRDLYVLRFVVDRDELSHIRRRAIENNVSINEMIRGALISNPKKKASEPTTSPTPERRNRCQTTHTPPVKLKQAQS